MKRNLRPAAANRDIRKAGELQRMLAERGVVISAGRCRGWSRTAASRYATTVQNLLDDHSGVRRDAVGKESGRS
ncbi:hypothetical protein [Streptomyces sp. NPDC002540]